MDAYLLTGPTAVGKTAITQDLAVQHGWPILSTDSMQVYRGMNIGTAKPSIAERGEVPYLGIDLVDPDEPFSTGDYLRTVAQDCAEYTTVLATGGTGLYLKALVLGLDELPAAPDELRARLEALFERDGLSGITREAVKHYGSLEKVLDDPRNPRRVMRALELAEMGVDLPRRFEKTPRIRLPALHMDRDKLKERILCRVNQMFDQGLLDEVEELLNDFPEWSHTATQAIGYKECRAILCGEISMEEGKERIAIRTRQYAKRQLTWLNNQFEVTWIEVGRGAVDSVQRYFEEHGPVRLAGI